MTPNVPNLDLDVSRAPRGVIAATQLVESAARLGDFAERHYLELKGPSNLDSKATKQKVAKFILAAANRLPEKASEAFEGCAVMILGITKEGIVGLPPIEMLELNKVVEQHTGPNGPRWDIVRVPVEGSVNEVLVIVVEPPQPGKPAWICRASGDGLIDGRIYIRADGETREATSAELDMLRDRAATPLAAPVELEVKVIGKVTPLIVDDAQTIEEYITATRVRLLSALPAPEAKAGTRDSGAAESTKRAYSAAFAQLAAINGLVDLVPEKRTQDQYHQQIEQWEVEFRAAWPNVLLQFASYVDSPNEVEVINKTTTFLHDVEVSIHIDGDVSTVEPLDLPGQIRDLEIEVPEPPQPWGPRQRGFSIGPSYYSGLMPPAPNLGAFKPSSSTWRNSGSVDTDVDVGNLRPMATFRTDDEEAVLVVIGAAPEAFTGNWTATARDYNEVFRGELTVEAEGARDLTPLVRAFFGLTREGGA